ncbi:MAG TPA: outer membrane beta-barrel protein [Candidatus Binatia bacterium]|nr:outer membrane beta-barrel protein [Candidatus Binatia bacterium]
MRKLLCVVLSSALVMPLMAEAAKKKDTTPPAPAPAAEKPATPVIKPAATGPTLSDILANSGVTISGTVDASWDFSDVDGGPNNTLGTPPTGVVAFVPLHAFDTAENAFSLHQVNLTVAKQPSEGAGFLVNVIGGDDAGIIGGKQADLDLTQGFLSYTTGGLTVIGGRFVTLAGLEVINPASNLNASRGLLFTLLQPITHTGVRATYKIGSAASLTAGVNNSAAIFDYSALSAPIATGSLKNENNTSKTLELQAGFTPSSSVGAFLTYYRGEEDTDTIGGVSGEGSQTKQLTDLVVTANFGMLTVGLNGDYLTLEANENANSISNLHAWGAAGYVGANLGKLRTALRGEYVNFDLGSAAGGSGLWAREVTLTFGYKVASSLELIVEGRHDEIDTVGGAASLPLRDTSVDAANDDQYTGTIKGILTF